MGRIDDPLDQIGFQHREAGEDDGLATVTLTSAAVVSALLTQPAGAALLALTEFARHFLFKHRRQSRVYALQDGLRDGIAELKDQIEVLEKKLVGPDAEEAVFVAFGGAMNSSRLDKARRFGRVLGATLIEDAPNWREASEFIRNLEELNDADLEAMRVLWRVQRVAYRVVLSDNRRWMSTDANDYTKTWRDVLGHAEKASISKDDWDSRCARLSGFGLTVMVQPSTSFQGPDDTCYRLTGRAVRLMNLLGIDVDPSKYPAWRYHATKPPVIIEDEVAERALGEGWSDTPAAHKEGNRLRG